MGLWPERSKTTGERSSVSGSKRLEVILRVLDVEALYLQFRDDRVPKKVQRLAGVFFAQGFPNHDPEQCAGHIVSFGPALIPLAVP